MPRNGHEEGACPSPALFQTARSHEGVSFRQCLSAWGDGLECLESKREMFRPCQVPGCVKPAASRYSRYCSAHKLRHRRHGHATQEAVSAAELAPFIRRVEARVAKNADSPVWAKLEERWELLVEHCRRITARTRP
jgi:hypothetical protein